MILTTEMEASQARGSRRNAPGRRISFEGLHGAGKSTQLVALATMLRQQGMEVVVTREPGGTALGEQIRAMLLNRSSMALSSSAELALMFASRAQLVSEVIAPALESGAWVLCDRFVDSSEAYQGHGRQLGEAAVFSLHHARIGGLHPDLTIWLKHDVEESLRRAQLRQQQDNTRPDRFESEDIAFYRRVHDGFAHIAARDQRRVITLDAMQSIAAIHEIIVATVMQRLLDPEGSEFLTRTQEPTPEPSRGAAWPALL